MTAKLAAVEAPIRIQIRCNKCGQPTGAAGIIFPAGLLEIDHKARAVIAAHNTTHLEGTHHG